MNSTNQKKAPTPRKSPYCCYALLGITVLVLVAVVAICIHSDDKAHVGNDLSVPVHVSPHGSSVLYTPPCDNEVVHADIHSDVPITLILKSELGNITLLSNGTDFHLDGHLDHVPELIVFDDSDQPAEVTITGKASCYLPGWTAAVIIVVSVMSCIVACMCTFCYLQDRNELRRRNPAVDEETGLIPLSGIRYDGL